MSPPEPISHRVLPWLAFAACCLIWGSTWIAHKWALADLTPLGLSTLRFSCASVICLLIARLTREQWVRRDQVVALLIAGLVLVGASNVLTSWTLLHIPSGVGAVLQAPIPVWFALLTWRSEPIRLSGWIAIFLGFFGVAVVMWPDGTHSLNATAAIVCAATAAAWCWASLYQRRHVRSGGLFGNAGLQMAFSGVLGIALTVGTTGFTRGHEISQQGAIALAYLVIGGSCVAFAS